MSLSWLMHFNRQKSYHWKFHKVIAKTIDSNFVSFQICLNIRPQLFLIKMTAQNWDLMRKLTALLMTQPLLQCIFINQFLVKTVSKEMIQIKGLPLLKVAPLAYFQKQVLILVTIVFPLLSDHYLQSLKSLSVQNLSNLWM